jgi:muramoyltetrapeptide carboxypeptidase
MVFPRPLEERSGIAVVAPASFVEEENIEPGLELIDGWGFTVHRGACLYNRYGQYSGVDEERLQDLQWALDHQNAGAIIMARGGYGISRILDRLDFTHFSRYPKWVVGFSDITGMHCHLHNLGYASIHGPMPGYYVRHGASNAVHGLRDLLLGLRPDMEVSSHHANRTGTGTGVLIGGNLSILCHLAGSVSEIDTKGKVLLLEDVGEYRYNIDRMFVQLKRSGKLEHLAGLLIGSFNALKEPKNPFGSDLESIVREHTKLFDYPVAFGFPVGHQNDNRPLIFGAEVRLEVGTQSSVLSYTKAQSRPADLPV